MINLIFLFISFLYFSLILYFRSSMIKNCRWLNFIFYYPEIRIKIIFRVFLFRKNYFSKTLHYSFIKLENNFLIHEIFKYHCTSGGSLLYDGNHRQHFIMEICCMDFVITIKYITQVLLVCTTTKAFSSFVSVRLYKSLS